MNYNQSPILMNIVGINKFKKTSKRQINIGKDVNDPLFQIRNFK